MSTSAVAEASLETTEAPVELVTIACLIPTVVSVRYGPLDGGHIRALREVVDVVPPILVHRATMTVIDGAHRLQAAREAGQTEIRVVFFDGNVLDAFVLAIQANSAHGRPLSIDERKGAARRLLDQRPEWSTRWIAAVCGLSSATVATLRPVPLVPEKRVGQDGRRRPVDPGAVRAEIAQRFIADPDASVRRVATDLGVSPATVRRVAATKRSRPGGAEAGEGQRPTSGPALNADPFTRWLDATAVSESESLTLLDQLPASHFTAAAEELRRRSRYWAALAETAEQLAETFVTAE